MELEILAVALVAWALETVPQLALD